MWQYRQTNELYHVGVKGMKWGVRKAGIAPEPKKSSKYDETGQNNQAKRERAKTNGKIATAAVLGSIGTMAIGTAAAYFGIRSFLKKSGLLDGGLFD